VPERNPLPSGSGCRRTESMDFKTRLKARREELKMSGTELARKAGIQPGTLHDLETGRTKVPTGDTLLALAKALRMPPFTLRHGDGSLASSR